MVGEEGTALLTDVDYPVLLLPAEGRHAEVEGKRFSAHFNVRNVALNPGHLDIMLHFIMSSM